MTRWYAHPSFRWTLVVLHLVFLGVIHHTHGIHTDKEALKYIGAAEGLIHGDTDAILGRYAMYAGYILFLAPFVALGMPMLAVGVQIGLGIAAAFALARIALRAGASATVAHGAMAALLFAYPVQQWSLSLYSEGLFIPLVLLLLDQALRTRPKPWTLLLLALCVVAIRPTGLLFVAPALVLPGHGIASRLPMKLRWCLAGVPLVLLLLAPVLPSDQLAGMVQQHVVLGFPQRPDAVYDPGVRTLAHVQTTLVRTDGVLHWIGTMGRRMISLFNPMRPWFSPLHNLLVAPLLLLYPFAIMGLWRARRSATGRVCLAALAMNMLLVALTYDEWGGRFLAPLLPLVILCAALGLRASTSAAHRA